MILVALWLAVAGAQEDAPAMSGNGLAPSVFSARGIVTPDTDTSRLGAATVHVGWAHLPFVVRGEVEKAAVVREDLVASVSGGLGFGPLRVGATFAGHLATSDRFEGVRTAPGDVVVDVHFVPFAAAPKRPGFGLLVRLDAPLGGSRLGLGGGGVGFEATALLDGVAGPVWIAAEAGLRDVKPLQIGDVSVDTSLVFRQATGVRLTRRGGLTLEWQGAVGLLHPLRRETTPIEALLSGWIDVDSGLSVRLGAGTAVVQGWSAPPVRAFAEIHGEFARKARPTH